MSWQQYNNYLVDNKQNTQKVDQNQKEQKQKERVQEGNCMEKQLQNKTLIKFLLDYIDDGIHIIIRDQCLKRRIEIKLCKDCKNLNIILKQ